MAAPLELDLFSGPDAAGNNYLFWYGGLLLSLALLYVVASRLTGSARWPASALVCAAVLVVGSLATPIGSLWGSVTEPGRPLPGKRVTPQLYEALRWIADETSTDSVLAVNNHWFNRQRLAPVAFDYSAFSERRVFLEGRAYSQRAFAEGYAEVGEGRINPFVDRLRLNQAAFVRGDRQALQTMAQRYGVRYLVIDQVNGYRADLPALERATNRVPGAGGQSDRASQAPAAKGCSMGLTDVVMERTLVYRAWQAPFSERGSRRSSPTTTLEWYVACSTWGADPVRTRTTSKTRAISASISIGRMSTAPADGTGGSSS